MKTKLNYLRPAYKERLSKIRKRSPSQIKKHLRTLINDLMPKKPIGYMTPEEQRPMVQNTLLFLTSSEFKDMVVCIDDEKIVEAILIVVAQSYGLQRSENVYYCFGALSEINRLLTGFYES